MTPFALPQRCLALLAAAPHPAEEDIRRQAEMVFKRPEFAPSGENRLLQLLLGIFRWLGTLHSTAPVLFWMLLIGCVVLLLLIVAHIAWTVRRVFHASARNRGERPEARRSRLSATCWEEARACASRGEFTEAVRYLFLS